MARNEAGASVAKALGADAVAAFLGVVDQVDATRIVIRATEDTRAEAATVDIYKLSKFQRSNQNTCINQRPLVRKGDKVERSDILADAAAQLKAYPTAQIYRCKATAVSREDGELVVEVDGGARWFTGRRVLLATGVRDELPHSIAVVVDETRVVLNLYQADCAEVTLKLLM